MASTTVERTGRSAVVHLRGDVAIPTAGALYHRLRALCRRRDVRTVVVDFSGAGRVDSAGIAVLALLGRQLAHAGKQLDLQGLDVRQRAAFELLSPREAVTPAEPPAEPPGALEVVGD